MAQHGMPHTQQHTAAHNESKPAVQNHERGQGGEGEGQGPGMNHLFNQYDPMLDADPFGLSASMHFPTNYSFDHPPQR